MNARELIDQVEGLGITLRVVGDKLKIKAQLGVITPEIKAQLTHHKTEIMQVFAQPANLAPTTRIYHVVIDTDGAHKGMTVIDPSGGGPEAFERSCCNRFGSSRVISIEPLSTS